LYPPPIPHPKRGKNHTAWYRFRINQRERRYAADIARVNVLPPSDEWADFNGGGHGIGGGGSISGSLYAIIHQKEHNLFIRYTISIEIQRT